MIIYVSLKFDWSQFDILGLLEHSLYIADCPGIFVHDYYKTLYYAGYVFQELDVIEMEKKLEQLT